MTGISIPGQQERMEDVPAQRYAKMRNVAMRYNIIQFGVAIFHESSESAGGYVAHVYNFYIFPETGPVNMEGSAVAFNRDHGMDWNKWIREGIPYVNRQTAKKLRESLLPKEEGDPSAKEKAAGSRITLTKDADLEMTGSAIAAVRVWLADHERKQETEFEVITTNAYLRRFFYETFAADFPELVLESRQTASARGMATLVALRLDEAQKAERAAKQLVEKQAQVDKKLGFSRVFEALVQAKKPLVGHACMYDFLFALSHFEGPLPESYTKYNELYQSLFPVLYDTQLLSKREPFKFVPLAADADPLAKREQRFGSMALGQVYKVVEQEAAAARSAGRPTVEVAFAPGHDRYGPDCAAFHEAGYDAYVTGYVFAHMAKEALSTDRSPTLTGRTTMFRSLFDFNLAGDDELVARGVYVHMRGLRGHDEADLKAAYAQIKAPPKAEKEEAAAAVQVRWLDDDSAFAVLPEDCRGEVETFLAEQQAAQKAREEAPQVEGQAAKAGFSFTAGEEWFAAQRASTEAKAGEEPPAKRARTA
ncbi:unnamed protein product [Polarella glacialis]|uniref:Uncharacterized protein n=1 Tax=Polarella glacialis TaxID=89957 RepID=A0A813HSL9_POLGL|nr:unnamed protein product [Polarella glacialis]